VIGHAGAGKSTLLRVMNLLERPERGTVHAAGRELTALGERELRAARQEIGMVLQECHLLHKLTVLENVAFPLRLHGRLNAPRLAARVQEALELAGIAELAARYPAALNAAQRQRVAIARALVNHPAVLLCDAPTAGLSPDAARALFDTLDAINRALGVALVVASADLPLLGALSDRVAVLEHGVLAEQFATADTSRARDTALGRELAFYSSEADVACQWDGATHA
ncbi:MAG: ATP-binding cassette domain-containing protein, partial [Gammaproteobacteria bacterium]